MSSENAFRPIRADDQGTTQLLRGLARECPPTQFLRELVYNGIEACQRVPDHKGDIFVTHNEEHFAKTGIKKFCVIDDGDGMSPDQLENLMSGLAKSGQTGKYAKYGMGARISTICDNPEGVWVESRRIGSDNCYRAVIYYDKDRDMYGLYGFENSDGSIAFVQPIKTPACLPRHGTRVTLMGMSEDQDTMKKPKGVEASDAEWRYQGLNRRFYTMPKDITIRGTYSYKSEDRTANIHGQKYHLDRYAIDKGQVELRTATAHWWITKPEYNPETGKRDGPHSRDNCRGHSALLNENEIFEMRNYGVRLRDFGLYIGRDQFVIYIEPHHSFHGLSRGGVLDADTQQSFDWGPWYTEFKEKMPPELSAFMKDLWSKEVKEEDNSALMDKLAKFRDLFRLSRWKRSKTGQSHANPDDVTEGEIGFEKFGDPDPEPKPEPRPEPRPGPKPGPNINLLLADVLDAPTADSITVTDTNPNPFPNFQWAPETTKDADLKDCAAEYAVTQNLIWGNQDFVGIHDTIEYFIKLHPGGCVNVIGQVVRETFKQVIVEGVTGAICLRSRPAWAGERYERAISNEALTTLVAPRLMMIHQINRQLGTKFGKGEG